MPDCEKKKSTARLKKDHEKLHTVQAMDTNGQVELELIQRALVDIHAVRAQLNDIANIAIDQRSGNNSSQGEIAEKSAVATEKLDVVQNYLMEALDSSIEVALHKAKWGEKEFCLPALPDRALEILLQYLHLQDKMNLRLVCKGMSAKVLINDPEMRKWKTNLICHPVEALLRVTELETIKIKGFPSLPNFQLQFMLLDREHWEIVREWRDYTVSLIIMNPRSVYPVHCEHLVSLELLMPPHDMLTSLDTVREMIKTHRHTLKRLSLIEYFCMVSNDEDLFVTEEVMPVNLDFLYLSRCKSMRPLIGLAAHVTKLVINITPKKFIIPSTHTLPKLRQLKITGFRWLSLVVDNADRLQVLHLQEPDDTEDDYVAEDYDKCIQRFPGSLPNLTTLILDYKEIQPFFSHVLASCENSVQRLVVKSTQEPQHDDWLPQLQGELCHLENLRDFVLAAPTAWSMAMILFNSDTIKHIVFGISEALSYAWRIFIDQPACLPILAHLTLVVGEDTQYDHARFLHKDISKFRSSHPRAKVDFEKLNFGTFLKTYFKLHNVDLEMHGGWKNCG